MRTDSFSICLSVLFHILGQERARIVNILSQEADAIGRLRLYSLTGAEIALIFSVQNTEAPTRSWLMLAVI